MKKTDHNPKDLNSYIKKSHLKAVEKFNADLQAFAKVTEEEPPTLYEDAFTSFTLWNVRVENGYLLYEYDGKDDRQEIVRADDEDGSFFERDDWDSIPEYLKFWKACLRKAKRYWSMDPDRLDAIHEGEAEDVETGDPE